MTARLVAYAPNGARLGILPEPLEWAASTPVGEFGGLTLSYASSAAGAEVLTGRRLDAGLELAVEVWTGAAWIEPEGARFIALRRGRDQADPAGVLDYTAVGYGWITTRVLHLAPSESMYAGPGENEGQRLLTGTPGAIINTLLAEYQARGGPAIARTFTNTTSSKGAAWSGSVELWVSRGEALDAILDRLAVQADIDHWWEGRTLCMAATRGGTDRTSSVILRVGTHVVEAPAEDAIEELISVHTLHGGEGIVHTTTEPSAPTPWGRWEGFAADDKITTVGAATARNQRVLADAARERSSYTHDLIESTDLVIGHHVKVGDWITAPGYDVLEKLRVAGLQWRYGADGLTQTLMLNDRLLNAELRRLKKERTGEAAGSTGAGSTVTSPGQDRRTPAKTTGVTASSYSYITPTGGNRAGILIDWTEVNQAAPEHGGGLMVIERYEVGYRPGSSGTWTILPFTARPADLTDLPVKTAYQIKVRARGQYSVSPGIWSDVVSVTTAHDTTPPPVPSLPTLSAARGVVTITWNGKTAADAAQPADFDHVVVEWDGVSVLTGNAVAGVDRLTGRGALDVAQLKPGTTARARLSAVDRTGNASTFTGWATVTVSSVLDDTGLGERLAGMDTATTQAKADAAQAIAGAAAAHGLASTALTSANGRNSRITSLADPSGSTHPETGAALVKGDTWWRWDDVTARNVIGQWEWSGTAWRREMISDQTIASLDLNKLTVSGSARMSQAVADKVIADAGYYGALTADRMVIASTSNMIPWNPKLGIAPHVGFGGATLSASNEPYYGWAIKADGGSNVAGTWGSFAQLRPEAPSRRGDVESWDVQPGESFRLRVGFNMRGIWNADLANRYVRARIVFLAANGSTWAGSATGTAVSPIVSPAGELRYSEALGTVPAGAVRMRVYLQRLCGNETGAAIWVTNPTLTPAVDGSLTVENSITGSKLFIDEAFMTKLKAGFGEFDSVLTGLVKAEMIDVTNLTVRRLKTNATANRGVEISDDRIRIYNTSGTNVIGELNSNGTLYLDRIETKGGVIEYTDEGYGPSQARIKITGPRGDTDQITLGINGTQIETNTAAHGGGNGRGQFWVYDTWIGAAVDKRSGSSAAGHASLDLSADGSSTNIEQYVTDSAGRTGRLHVRPTNIEMFMYGGRTVLKLSDGTSGLLEFIGGAPTYRIIGDTEPAVEYIRNDTSAGIYTYATSSTDGELGIRIRPIWNSGTYQTFWYLSKNGRMRSVVDGVTRDHPFATYGHTQSVTPAAANTTYSYTVTFPAGMFTATPKVMVNPVTSAPQNVQAYCGLRSATSCTVYYRRSDTTSFAIDLIAFQPTP